MDCESCTGCTSDPIRCYSWLAGLPSRLKDAPPAWNASQAKNSCTAKSLAQLPRLDEVVTTDYQHSCSQDLARLTSRALCNASARARGVQRCGITSVATTSLDSNCVAMHPGRLDLDPADACFDCSLELFVSVQNEVMDPPAAALLLWQLIGQRASCNSQSPTGELHARQLSLTRT